MPTFERTLGPEVAAVCTLAGYVPDPEQQLLIDATFAIDNRGRSAAFEVAAIACRQNLKTGLLKQTALGWLFVTDERLIVWSAHLFETSSEAFRDLEELITGSDLLRKRIRRVSRGNGDEAIETLTGARIIFKTRTKGGGRGLSGRKVILDEAFALQPGHMGALIPVLSAQPDPQILYGSSAALPESDVLRDLVKRLRGGNDPRLAGAEWCADEPAVACKSGEACDHAKDRDGCSYDDPEQWRKANPQAGRRISIEYIAGERRAMPVDEFGRERMGHHDKPAAGVSVIDLFAWARNGDADAALVGPVALGVDARPESLGAAASLVVAGRHLDGVSGVEVVDDRPGTAWVVERVVEIVDEHDVPVVALDPSGPAGVFLQPLLDTGRFVQAARDEQVPAGKTRLFLIGAREYAQACGAWVADTREGALRHFDQKPMNEAVEGARTQPLADAFKWSRKDSTVNICPLVAGTVARAAFGAFGASATPEPWVMSG